MALFGFGKKKEEKTRTIEVETKSAGLQADSLREILVFGSRKGAHYPKVCLDMYEDSTAVSIPVNKIAKAFSELTPIIKVGEEKIREHPMLDLLENPSPEYSKELYFRTLAVYYLVTGEFFNLYLGRKGNPPREVYPMNPALVNHMNRKGFITQLNCQSDFFPGEYFKDESVYWSNEEIRCLGHGRNFSTRDNSMFRGQSLLIPASNAARQQVLGAQHNLTVLEKGGKLSLVFHFENDLSDSEFEKVKEKVRAQFSGPSNAGEIGVTAGGKLSIQDMGLNHADMDWSNGMKMASEVLLLTYDIPLPLVSMDSATHSNFENSIELFYDDAVTPLSNTIFGSIQKDLIGRFDLPPRAKLTFDEDSVPALRNRQLRLVAKRSELDVETDNEIRNLLGRESYSGGDLIYKNSNKIPVGTDVVTSEVYDQTSRNDIKPKTEDGTKPTD